MAKNRWNYSVCNLTSQRILLGCVCVCMCVYMHTNLIFVPRDSACVYVQVCVRCCVKPLIEKQATVATCLTVSPSICLEQHGASTCEGGREGAREREDQATWGGLHSFLLSLSLLIIWETMLELKQTHSLHSVFVSPPLVTVWVFLSSIIRESAPGHITTRRALLWV